MTAVLLPGDCRDTLAFCVGDDEIDSIVTDPPYELAFMGRRWDASGVAFDVETWRQCLRVLKPGGYLLAFGGTRTYHRMICAIEDAGFEIRDCLMWVYGSGFPKSHNGEWGGTALKPAWEPICMARKPLIGTVEANWREHGVGGLNIDGCRVETSDNLRSVSGFLNPSGMNVPGKAVGAAFVQPLGRWPANLCHDGSDEVLTCFPESAGQLANESRTAPSSKTGRVFGPMKRVGEPSADSANEGAVGFSMKPGARRFDAGSAARFFYCAKASREDRNEGCEHIGKRPLNWSSGTQSPGTFQAEGTDRSAHNHHPTVKPTDLMRWFCRLVTPAGGLVLDPFMGSGSTGKACALEGFRFLGIELDPQYIEIARARIDAAAKRAPPP